MKLLVIASAFVTAWAATAQAGDQLALSLGVEPGMYSTSELVSLMNAREDGDAQREKFILNGGNEIISTQSFGSERNSQLAMSLGVEPGMYSTSELTGLMHARENNDIQRVNFILGGRAAE
ncbi:hypothetical protein [Mangrovicoccus sp. HB161399]|uniref:hypothetical protein n=1 Tax=Mangrovicoccus sp. HB161399 TaxID=2720392 RepID=UPI0015547DDE|nr:hypothetical protein [Mangrovicoccus sp. HB161399]